MPSTKKRINLTVPDNIYQQLQTYKIENGLESDATACLQLVVRQLKAEENAKNFQAMIRSMTEEQLQEISSMGVAYTKSHIDSLSE